MANTFAPVSNLPASVPSLPTYAGVTAPSVPAPTAGASSQPATFTPVNPPNNNAGTITSVL